MQVSNISNNTFGAGITHRTLVGLAKDTAYPTYKDYRVNQAGLRGFLRTLRKTGDKDTLITNLNITNQGNKTMTLRYPNGKKETVSIYHEGFPYDKTPEGRTIFYDIISALKLAEITSVKKRL